MKRLATLFLAAGMLMVASAPAKAVDVKIQGHWQFGFEWANSGLTKQKTKDTFNAVQRLRTQIDLIASESLRGIVYFEIGKTQWGVDQGGTVGSDTIDIKLRYSYVDWIVPDTDVKVRMGIQPYLLPNFVAGENVLGTDGAGITVSYWFNEMVGATAFWLRAENDNSGSTTVNGFSASEQNDAADFYGITIPVKGDGFQVVPWGLMGSVGSKSLGSWNGTSYSPAPGYDGAYLAQGLMPYAGAVLLPQSDIGYETPWWLGIGGELTLFSPFRIAAEFRYGQADFGDVALAGLDTGAYTGLDPNKEFDIKRSGWYAGLIAEYKLDFVTPGVIFWYTSGDNSNPYDGSERMPYVTENSTGGWGATNFGFDGGSSVGVSNRYDVIGQTNIGTWGIIGQLKDLSFVDKLTHTIKFGYYMGTNNKNMPKNAGMSTYLSGSVADGNANIDGLYMTTKDHAFEIDFVTDYQIYPNLAASLDLAYMRIDMDSGVWEETMGAAWNNREENAYRVGVYMRYNF